MWRRERNISLSNLHCVRNSSPSSHTSQFCMNNSGWRRYKQVDSIALVSCDEVEHGLRRRLQERHRLHGYLPRDHIFLPSKSQQGPSLEAWPIKLPVGQGNHCQVRRRWRPAGKDSPQTCSCSLRHSHSFSVVSERSYEAGQVLVRHLSRPFGLAFTMKATISTYRHLRESKVDNYVAYSQMVLAIGWGKKCQVKCRAKCLSTIINVQKASSAMSLTTQTFPCVLRERISRKFTRRQGKTQIS